MRIQCIGGRLFSVRVSRYLCLARARSHVARELWCTSLYAYVCGLSEHFRLSSHRWRMGSGRRQWHSMTGMHNRPAMQSAGKTILEVLGGAPRRARESRIRRASRASWASVVMCAPLRHICAGLTGVRFLHPEAQARWARSCMQELPDTHVRGNTRASSM